MDGGDTGWPRGSSSNKSVRANFDDDIGQETYVFLDLALQEEDYRETKSGDETTSFHIFEDRSSEINLQEF